MATDHIERFVKEGIRLAIGRDCLPADIIVTATGMRMRIMDGVEIIVDGEAVDLGDTLELQGHHVQQHPQPGIVLRLYQCLVDAQMRIDLRVRLPLAQLYGAARITRHCVPRLEADSPITEPMINFTSSYVRRAQARFAEARNQALPGRCIRIT